MLPQPAIDAVITAHDMAVCVDSGRCSDPMHCGSWNSCGRSGERFTDHLPKSAPREPYPHERVAALLIETQHAAEDDLIGKRITLTHGSVGTIKDVKLDSVHGLMFTCNRVGHPEPIFYPVSVIKEIHP